MGYVGGENRIYRIKIDIRTRIWKKSWICAYTQTTTLGKMIYPIGF